MRVGILLERCVTSVGFLRYALFQGMRYVYCEGERHDATVDASERRGSAADALQAPRRHGRRIASATAARTSICCGTW